MVQTPLAGEAEVESLARSADEAGAQHAVDRAVLVVDDQRIFAEALMVAIDVQRDMHCIGAANSAEAGLALVRESRPDVILLDLRLPGMDGLAAIPRFRESCPHARILILTANTTPEALFAAAEAGADGFLPKEHRFLDLLDAVRRVEDDALFVDRETLGRVRRVAEASAAAGAAMDEASALPQLTGRELQILRLLADGLAVKEIARDLGISVHTCRGHVRGLLQKLEVHSQLAAVAKAARAGLLPRPTE